MEKGKNLRQKLCRADEAPESGKSRVFSLEGGLSLLLCNIDNQLFCLENRCPHMGAPLEEGAIEEGCITCPWHGWSFDIQSGQCLHRNDKKVQSWQVVRQGEDLFLQES